MADIPWTLVGIIAGIVASVIFIVCCVCCIKKTCCGRRNAKARSGTTSRGKNHKVPTSNTLDLHGHSVKSARYQLDKFLKGKKEENGCRNKTLSVITGKGNHSRDGRPVLKPVVQNHLRKKGYKHKVDPRNAGRIIVERDYYDIV